MEDYITLTELYIYNAKLFKNKNLKSFINHHKIQDDDMVKLKGSKIGIKKHWIKKNIPLFDLKLNDYTKSDQSYTKSDQFYEVSLVMEKYGYKTFNPVHLNMDSSMVKYFNKEGKRTPFFTFKGLIKIMVFFNDISSPIFEWLNELINGRLHNQINNLSNIIEMVNIPHIPVIKNINDEMIFSNHIYNVTTNDIIIDFKRIGDLKKESNLNKAIEDYKCPLYTQLQLQFKKDLEEVENNYNQKLKDLKQEKIISHLQLELEKEKSLKDQAISLTQSFIPGFIEKQAPSISPIIKPSKIY